VVLLLSFPERLSLSERLLVLTEAEPGPFLNITILWLPGKGRSFPCLRSTPLLLLPDLGNCGFLLFKGLRLPILSQLGILGKQNHQIKKGETTILSFHPRKLFKYLFKGF